MRLWSLHPRLLDTKGLVALWREGLLARKVLLGKTKGYKNHPQLDRFKIQNNPIESLDSYLYWVWLEATQNRNFNFNGGLIEISAESKKIQVSFEQVKFELLHLQMKLLDRSPEFCLSWLRSTKFIKDTVSPIFEINYYKESLESWERSGYAKYV